MQVLVDTLASLVSGAIQAQFLELTLNEVAWNSVNFLVGLLFATAGFGITTVVVEIVVGMFAVLLLEVTFIVGAIAGGFLTPLDLVLPLIALLIGVVLALTLAFPAASWAIAFQGAILSTPYGQAICLLNLGIFLAQMFVDYWD